MASHKTDLYFEAHVTIDPVEDEERLRSLKFIGQAYSFRVAELLYKKTREVARIDDFLTGRSIDYRELHRRTIGLVGALQEQGFVVRRFKIENTLLDVRVPSHGGLDEEVLQGLQSVYRPSTAVPGVMAASSHLHDPN
jgi:hypothetical protein